MRPLKLEVEGFTSFRQPACLDFEGHGLDLFAITGPTGAGKSSLIDAICYALYGRVPRVGDDVGACISQGAERMRVTFEFQAGDARYRVYRETRRKGQPNARLDRLDGGEWRPLADRSREVTAAVVGAVGLDYEAFTRSVLLPQGQFQEFLAGDPRQRRSVLGSLLRLDVYERMRASANLLAGNLKERIDERQRELSGLADATPENLARLEGELAQRFEEGSRLQAEADSLARGLKLASALGQARERLQAREAEAKLLQDQLAATQQVVAAGDAELAALEQSLAEAEERLAANRFDPDRSAALTLALGRARDLARCLDELAHAQEAVEDSEARARQAGAAVAEQQRLYVQAQEELAAAEAARREAERHDQAAALRRGLRPGDTCPVCGGTVGELPPLAAEGLEAAEKRYQAARQAEETARKAQQAAADAAAKGAAVAQAAAKHLQKLQEERLRLAVGLEEALPEGVDASLAAIEAALAEQEGARAQRVSLEAEVKEKTGALERRRSELAEARGKLAVLSKNAADADEALQAARQEVDERRAQLAEHAAGADWPEVQAAVRVGDDAVPALQHRQQATQEALRENASVVGQLQERLSRLREDIGKAQKLQQELEAIKQEHGVAADLAQMLQANRFQAFVQSEALRTLAADGSRRLAQLSAGRYRLAVEAKGQEFEVIDQWNADEARSVRTLSGGETFLASLALALALSESLPGLAASRRVVLDSIFLDEGFGSLDPEALDRAAEALDALRTENRMVCVVTHLRELAERLPARVLVTKSETGSSVAVV